MNQVLTHQRQGVCIHTPKKKQLTHQLLQFFVTFLGRRAKEKKTRQNNEYELTIITIGNHHHKLGTGGRSHHGVVVRGGDLFSCSFCGWEKSSLGMEDGLYWWVATHTPRDGQRKNLLPA